MAQQINIPDPFDRLDTDRKRIEWVVEVAQIPYGSLSTGQTLDRSIELNAFMQWSGGLWRDPGDVKLDMTNGKISFWSVQQEFARIIGAIVAGESVSVGSFKVDLKYSNGYLSKTMLNDDSHGAKLAAFALGLLLDEFGSLIKSCPAPKPRSDEPCNKWFVGRPDQVYCSTQCQVRVGSRATRKRQLLGRAETKKD